MRHISASILACDVFDIERNVKLLNDSGVDSIHYDVMDGHYVDAISGSSELCKAISTISNLPIYAHLMTTNPEIHINRFKDAGVRSIAFHPVYKDTNRINKIIADIKNKGLDAGLAVSNNDEISSLQYISDIDYIIVMTVVPGRCGQAIKYDMIQNISKVKSMLGPQVKIFADGGINDKTILDCSVYGVDSFVVGSYLFRESLKRQVENLRS